MKLVALGVTAEIVVIVENKNPRVGALLAIKMRRRQAADAGAHDNEVVVLSRRSDFAGLKQELAVAQTMGGFESAWMTAAQPGQGWRIVSGQILRRLTVGQSGRKTGRQRLPGNSDRKWNAVEKIPPCN